MLDWGSGLGGTALALAQECGADDVLGIDIEPGNIRLSEELIGRHGLSGRIKFLLVQPGPLPLEPRAPLGPAFHQRGAVPHRR